VDHHGAVTDETGTWYYAWLPGPWLRIRGPEWPQPLGSDYRSEVLEVECGICGDRLTMSSWEDDPSERLQARIHWERHVAGEVPTPYFVLPGVGDTKTLSRGTWADVIVAVPYLMWKGDPIPPRSVVNEILADGSCDAGMSGGCEWPRHQLSEEEYARLRRDLTELGYLDLDAPTYVVVRTDYDMWKQRMRPG
jgi:hypothetical protein